jgi:hypothetical protein
VAGHHARIQKLKSANLDQGFQQEYPIAPGVFKSWQIGMPRKVNLLPRKGIPKNTHLKPCQEEDKNRRFLRRNPKDYIFKILLLRIVSIGANSIHV